MDSQKYVKFQLGEKFYQFICLCFGLYSAPRIFTKLMKVQISIFRRLNILIILHLDDIFLIKSSQKEMIVAKDTLVFKQQNLGFLMSKSQKGQRVPGVIMDSKEMTLSIPQKKV